MADFIGRGEVCGSERRRLCLLAHVAGRKLVQVNRKLVLLGFFALASQVAARNHQSWRPSVRLPARELDQAGRSKREHEGASKEVASEASRRFSHRFTRTHLATLLSAPLGCLRPPPLGVVSFGFNWRQVGCSRQEAASQAEANDANSQLTEPR